MRLPETATNRFELANLITAQLQREAQPGDILLFYHATGINRIIPLVTRSPFFHAAIYAGDNEVIEARPVGVIRRDMRQVEDVHYFVVIPAPQNAGRAALAWAETQIGAGYDRTDVLVMLLDRIFTNFKLNYTPPDKWTCGEFVATAFAKAGVNLFPEARPVDVEPGDFARFVPPQNRPDTTVQDRIKNVLFALGVLGLLSLLVAGVGYLRQRTRRDDNPSASRSPELGDHA